MSVSCSYSHKVTNWEIRESLHNVTLVTSTPGRFLRGYRMWRTCCLTQAAHFLDLPARGLVCQGGSSIQPLRDNGQWYEVLLHLCCSRPGHSNKIVRPHQPTSDGNKYKTLKGRLADTLGLSKQERATHLLYFHPLGDTKPSVLIDKMLALLRDYTRCLLFEQLFFKWLPKDIRIQLVDTKIEDHALSTHKTGRCS